MIKAYIAVHETSENFQHLPFQKFLSAFLTQKYFKILMLCENIKIRLEAGGIAPKPPIVFALNDITYSRDG